MRYAKIYLLLFLSPFFLIKNLEAKEFVISQEVEAFYNKGIETNRLEIGFGLLEKDRTQIILNKYLSESPLTILDVGGATGVYAFPLAKKGYNVYLIDPVPFHIEEAKKNAEKQKDFPLKDIIIGDARKIPMEDNSVDVVLFFGPLYHLDNDDQKLALAEAYRVLKPNGKLFAVGISKYAPIGAAILNNKLNKPQICESIEENLKSGELKWRSTTFYCHTPDELKKQIVSSGFENVDLIPIEGIGSWQKNILDGQYHKDEEFRKKLLYLIEKTEKEPSLLGLSNHIMAIGIKKG
jgi:ubiquinone/menaquinone biosynthesis C-methylase UbiE